MEDVILQRLDRLKKRLRDEDFDALLVMTGENRHYLSGFSARDGQFDESAGAVIVADSNQLIATDSRYEVQAKNEAKHFEILRYREGLAKMLPEILQGLQVKRLGFESARLSCHQFRKIQEQLTVHSPGVTLVPTEGLIEDLRSTKDGGEIQTMAEALALAEAVLPGILLELSAARKTERQIAWVIEKAMREAGAEAMAFPPIVAFGSNAAMPHAVPSGRVIKGEGPLLFDWGCRLNGYCSDISRTICIGPPDETFRKVFQTVLEAQYMAIEAIKPGVSTQAVDRIAREHIATQGFGDSFGHGLGHGVGLATHEKPHLSPIKPSILEAGMITTVEPGVYLPGWGGVRLENMVVVEAQGARILNNLPLDFDWIEVN